MISRKVKILFLIILVGVTIVLRFNALEQWKERPLEPDVIGYKAIALEMKHPYDTKYREPVQPWLLWIALTIFGSSDVSARWGTLCLSILILPLLLLFWKSVTGSWWLGYFSALLFALNGSLAEMNVKGYRTEVYTLLLIFFFAFSCGIFKVPPALRLLLTASSGALLCLTILASALLVLPVMACTIFQSKSRRWNQSCLSGTAFVCLLAPHLVYSHHRFGDPFHSINQHAAFYRNYEFAGQPGFPSREEIRRKPYVGGKISGIQYVFGMHTPFQVAAYTTWGGLQLLTIYVSPLLPLGKTVHDNLTFDFILGEPGFVPKILEQVLTKNFLLETGPYMLLHGLLIGCWLLGFTMALRRHTLLSVVWLSTLVPYAFIAGLMAIDWRLIAHFQVFVNGCTAIAFQRFVSNFRKSAMVEIGP